MIEQLRMGFTVFRILTTILNVEDDQMASIGPEEIFKILTSLLNIEDDQMASSGLNVFFRISTLILYVEDDEPNSTCLTCLVLVVASSRHR